MAIPDGVGEGAIVRSWGTELGREAVRRALGAVSRAVPVGIVATDADGASWYHNQRFEEVSGAIGVEFRGRPWHEAVHPDDVALVASRWRSVVDRRGRFGTFRTLDRLGTVHHCWGQATPVVSVTGQLDGYVVTVTDHEGENGLTTAEPAVNILAHAPAAITIVEPDGAWRWSSPAALALVGHIEQFDPADGIFQVLHPEDQPRARAELAESVAGVRAPGTRSQYRIRGADGQWRWLEVVVDPRLDDPAIQGIIIHSWDVTQEVADRETLELRNAQLANLIANLDSGIVVEDPDRRVLLANQALCDVLALDVAPEALVGRTILEAGGISLPTAAVDGPTAESELHRRLESTTPAGPVRTQLLDGRTIEWHIVPVTATDGYHGQIWRVDDVTDQARAELERQRLLDSARTENRKLAELAARRDELTASVSHELRTPLTAIVGHAQLLQDMLRARGADDELAAVEVIVRNVERLFGLAGDVLALESIEQGILIVPAVPVDLAQVVAEAVGAQRPRAQHAGVALRADLPAVAEVAGDPDRLRQLVDCLLCNATKFSRPGGEVTVTLAPGADGMELTVADQGIGIPPGELGDVHTRFYRASNAQALEIPGKGLGLTIAGAIARIHRGRIEVHSKLGTGTTVVALIAGMPNPVAAGGS